MEKKKLSAAILAGGRALRYGGENKSLITINGSTIVERNLEILKDLFDEIIIISNESTSYQQYSKITIAKDIYPNKGPLSGIHAALCNCSNSGVFVFACDMPNLDKDIILNQMQFFSKKRGMIIIPETPTGIEPLHAIYPVDSLTAVEALVKMKNNYPIRSLFSAYPTLFWKFNDRKKAEVVFKNINRPEDLEN